MMRRRNGDISLVEFVGYQISEAGGCQPGWGSDLEADGAGQQGGAVARRQQQDGAATPPCVR